MSRRFDGTVQVSTLQRVKSPGKKRFRQVKEDLLLGASEGKSHVIDD